MIAYQFSDDLEVICELLGITDKELASQIRVSQDTVTRWKNGRNDVSPDHMSRVYDFAFAEGIRLNKIKEQLYKEDCKDKNRMILFHGAKNNIEGKISIDKSRGTNDFGKGFYCGESLEQSAMFVSGYQNSSLYIFEFEKTGLSCAQFFVDRDWMLTIAFFRGRLSRYADHPMIRKMIRKVEENDYILAPIADNRMYEIIDSFINGEITDVQCQHCLSATNLGRQYILKTEAAVRQLELKRHCFLCEKEKKYYISFKQEESKIGNDKVRIARKQFRGQGKYIEEVLL